MAIPGLYIPIRGDYSDFQKDMARLAGIARMEGTRIAEALQMAISPKDADSGLRKLGVALKQLTAAAQSTGRTLNATLPDLDEFAKKANVASSVVEELHYEMLKTARDRQLERSLREIQRQCGLTASAMARLRTQMGDAGGSVSTAMEGLGIRPLRAIQAEIREVEAQYQHMLEMFRSGHATENDVSRAFARRGERMEALQREAGTWQDPARASALRQRYDTLVAQAGRGRTSFAQFEARNTARDAVNAFQELHGRLPRAAEIRQIAQACGASAVQIRRMRDELDHSSNAFKALIGYAQVWVTFGAFNMAKDFVQTAMELENVKVAFQAIYGSADMAEKKLDYVRKVSDQLGLSFMDTAEGAKKLFAAAQGTPVEGKANMVFKSFSDMSAALKLTGDETKGVFLAISQMISKGKVSAEELRQQLAERMPGAVNLFAKSIGVTTKQLDKMLQGGEVTLEHFLKFAEEVGKTYSAGARMAGHSLQAELNRLSNTWVDFQAKSTNTGALADGVRQLNDFLRGTLEIVAKLAPYMTDLAKITFAGWLTSALLPGAKLNAILAGLATVCSACIGPIKAFIASMAAAVVGAGSLSAAVKALGAAMWTMAKNPAFLALMATGAIALKVLTDDADGAKESFKKVTESMDEMRKKRLELEQADKASNFGSHDVVVGMDEQISKRIHDFEEERNKLQEQFNSLLTYNHFTNERVATTPGQLAVQGMLGQLDQFKKELRTALGNNDITAMDVLGERFWSSWKQVQKKLEGMNIDEGVKASIARGWAGFSQLIDATKTDLLRKLGELEKLGSGSLSTLGVSFAQTEKEAKKFAKAVGSSELGKVAAQMRGMESLKSIFGPVAMELGKVTDATVTYGNAAANYLEQMGKAPGTLEAHKNALSDMDLAVVKGTVSYDEYEAAVQRVQKEDAALREETQNVSQKMIDFALAMGGTNDAFNLVMQLCNSAGAAFRALGLDVQGTIADIRDFQISAATAVYAAKALAGGKAAEVQYYNAEAQQAIKNRDEKKFMEMKEKAARAQSDSPIQIIGSNIIGWQNEYKFGVKLDELHNSGKKGKKSGGGGSKKGGGRVDNTAEKYQSSLEGFRKEIAKLRGEVDLVTLDKKFADMDKQLKGSTADIKALKKEYFEAFNYNKVEEMRKEILRLQGDEQALAEINIAEKVKAYKAELEGIRKAAQELGVEVPKDLEKTGEAFEKALKDDAREQELQRIIGLTDNLVLTEDQRKRLYQLQNELLDLQYEKLKKIDPDFAKAKKEFEELEARVRDGDPFAGMELGFKRFQKNSKNMAEGLADAVENAFEGMGDALANFCQTGKLDFSDLVNSMIADLVRLSARAVTSKIFDLIGGGIGSLFGNLFGGGGAGAGISAGASWAGSGGAAASSVSSVAGSIGGAFALGSVLSGFHGYTNQIVTRPTLFSYGSQLTKFAKGGVMGEAGPEAIMPLARTPSGHLGVRTSGAGGGELSLSLTIVDQTKDGIDAENMQAAMNGMSVDVMVNQIDSKLAGMAASGKSKFMSVMEKTHRMPSTRGWN